MTRIRRHHDRAIAMHAEVELLAAHALGQSEPGPRIAVTVLVWEDDRPPRYPAVGLHPGAIEGTVPHRQRRLDRWTPRRG
jgi:hypothetical protein